MGVAGQRFAPSVHLGGLSCLILTPQMSSKHRGVIWGVLFSMPSEAAPALFPHGRAPAWPGSALSAALAEKCVWRALRLCHTRLPCLGGVNTLICLLWGSRSCLGQRQSLLGHVVSGAQVWVVGG